MIVLYVLGLHRLSTITSGCDLAVNYVGDANHDDQCAVKRNRTCISPIIQPSALQCTLIKTTVRLVCSLLTTGRPSIGLSDKLFLSAIPLTRTLPNLLMLPTGTMHDLHRTLTTGWVPAIECTDIDPHLRAIPTEAHTLTCIVVDGPDQGAVPAKGAGPGRPWLILFSPYATMPSSLGSSSLWVR